jgi:hypothetical protein
VGSLRWRKEAMDNEEEVTDMYPFYEQDFRSLSTNGAKRV